MYNNGGLEQFKVECEAAEQEEPKDEITAHPDNFTRSKSKLKKEKKTEWLKSTFENAIISVIALVVTENEK